MPAAFHLIPSRPATEALPPLDEVVRRHTELEPHGDYLLGKCPVHDDNRPSFTVRNDPVKGWLWHCFTCQRGGDVVQFVQFVEDCTESEALKKLTDAIEEDESVLRMVELMMQQSKNLPPLRLGMRPRLSWQSVRSRLKGEPWWTD